MQPSAVEAFPDHQLSSLDQDICPRYTREQEPMHHIQEQHVIERNTDDDLMMMMTMLRPMRKKSDVPSCNSYKTFYYYYYSNQLTEIAFLGSSLRLISVTLILAMIYPVLL